MVFTVLLVLIPISAALKYLVGASPLLVFASSALAIAVLAEWVRRATDQLADRVGPAIGGLTVRVIGLDRGIAVRTWARDDAAVRAALEADGSWDAQRALPEPGQLRRVILIEPDDGAPHPVGTQLDRWAERGILVVHRERVAFEEPGADAALHQALERARDMHDWVTVDALILTRGSGFAFRVLSDPDIVRLCCNLRVPILVQRGRLPTLIDEVAWRCFDSGEALNDALAEILRTEVRETNLPRLEAIVDELDRDQAGPVADPQGPLYD